MSRILLAAGTGEHARHDPSDRWQACLDALPIAAAVVMAGSAVSYEARNAAFDRLAAPEGAILAEAVQRLTAGQGPQPFAWTEPGVGGRHFQAYLRPIADRTPRFLLTLVDRTGEIETERSLRFEMLHDSLTGLPNRLAFAEAIDRAIAQGLADVQFAVVALNLTRFSRINEGMGALAGDELIITVARRLLGAVRGTDLLARFSGDEFAVLVELRDGPGDALHLARRLERALAAPLRLSDLEIRIDCAIGCAIHQDSAANAQDIIRNAQFALKRAKSSHRVEVYQPGEASAARRRFSLETELRRAIEREEIDVAFQPLVDLVDGRLIGFEALSRWTHREFGIVAPDEFISVAEESGLIVPLGRWTLDRAARAIAQWTDALGGPPPFYIGVNVSAVQLQRDALAAAVGGAMAAHGVDGRNLTLELTESSIVADPHHAASVLTALQSLGCRIAMDDFGTGHSSLASLQRLPIDILKIDHAFVCNILDDPDSAAIVRAIVSLSSALGMTTVAEGIETAAIAAALAAFGCHVGQGYHFAKAMPADDALVFYRMREASSRAMAATRS